MKLVDKIKNMFTEEVEEERPIIKKEVMQVQIDTSKEPENEFKQVKEYAEIKEEIPKEEKPAPIFFDDKDFDVLEKNKAEKVEKKEEQPSFKDKYKGNKPVEEVKVFKPSPIISPVYGILDKNYKKEEITTKNVIPTTVYYEHKDITIDDIRKKAYGTLEDDIETTLFGKQEQPMHEKKEEIFDDLLDETLIDNESNYDDSKQDDELNFDDFEYETKHEVEESSDGLDLMDDIMNSYEENEQTIDDNISDSDLFDLIDSMYEKGENE